MDHGGMNDGPDTAGSAADLAAYVLGQADKKAAAILNDARARAAAIEREAFAQARTRLQTAKQEERARARNLCREAEARMHARLAGRRRALDAQRLDLLRRQFSSVLGEFWRAPVLRDAWVRAAVARAQSAFATDIWTVELFGLQEPPESARSLIPENAEIICHGDGTPGLRIKCGGAVLDATAEGFLAQGPRLNALLLAALEDRPQGDAA